jgi:uncharacterized membrane protein YccC
VTTIRTAQGQSTPLNWLPALVNAGRAFAAIGAVTLFWIVTEWPSGASAISFTAIIVILLAPRADHAYASGIAFLLGTLVNVVLAATIAFAVLPGSGAETFAAFSLVIGLCLVPIGAPLRKGWYRMIGTLIDAPRCGWQTIAAEVPAQTGLSSSSQNAT